MTEQQYHVIADRDKGDDPKWPDIEPGDRYVAIARDLETRSDDDQVVRIERPVPTTEKQHQSLPTGDQIAEAKERELSQYMPEASPHERAIAASWFVAGAHAVLDLIQNGVDQ